MDAPTSLYLRFGKRVLDAVVAVAVLLLLAPLFALLALAVKLGSAGPVFFRQRRVGRGGMEFNIVKFRSMTADAERRGPGITAGGDPRISPVGRFLRKWKLDELPQFWNVLRGEMSLVGPRPELPQYVRDYTPRQRTVLAVRPGITDPASIAFRDEESVLAASADPLRSYVQVVLPQKLELNLQYIARASLGHDLWLLAQTLFCLVRPASSILQTGKHTPDAH